MTVAHANRRLMEDETVATGARAPAKLLDMEYRSSGEARMPVQQAATAVDTNHVETVAGRAVDLAQDTHFLLFSFCSTRSFGSRTGIMTWMGRMQGGEHGGVLKWPCLLKCCTALSNQLSVLQSSPS